MCFSTFRWPTSKRMYDSDRLKVKKHLVRDPGSGGGRHGQEHREAVTVVQGRGNWGRTSGHQGLGEATVGFRVGAMVGSRKTEAAEKGGAVLATASGTGERVGPAGSTWQTRCSGAAEVRRVFSPEMLRARRVPVTAAAPSTTVPGRSLETFMTNNQGGGGEDPRGAAAAVGESAAHESRQSRDPESCASQLSCGRHPGACTTAAA